FWTVGFWWKSPTGYYSYLVERFNKQKPRSFEKATAPVDAENWISHMVKIFDVIGCEDAFMTRLAVYKFEGNALSWWKAYKQAKGGDAWLITVTWVEFKKLFFLQFFRRAEQEPAGTEEEQAKNFQWGLRKSTLNHLMCMPFTDVAQVANAARNYEIPHERDDDDAERPDKRQKNAAGTEEEQAKNFQWGLRRSTLNHLICMSYTDVAQVANAASNYEILYERDDDDAERPDKQ
nr:hypothetical protein [Tanacetum cinerariifolium]